jgi:hypothetical protein
MDPVRAQASLMNFFGHAATAAHFTGDPSFVLGAMLPDFSSMIGARPPPVDSEALASGVRFHHATDGVFHDLEPFVRWQRDARQRLLELGLERGSARAIAHVGVELLIDEALSESEKSRRAYISALAVGRVAEIERAIGWRADERERYAFLIDRLIERGVALQPSPDVQAERLRRILAARPRLAFDAEKCPLVAEWIVEARPVVVGSTSALTDVLIEKLRHSMAGSPAVGWSSRT